MVAQQQAPNDETPCVPSMVRLACQSAVSYYYVSRASQGILANRADGNKIYFKNAMLPRGGRGGGLLQPQQRNPAMDWLESIYSKYHTTDGDHLLSYSDLYTLAGSKSNGIIADLPSSCFSLTFSVSKIRFSKSSPCNRWVGQPFRGSTVVRIT